MTAPERPEISPLPVFGPYELESQALAAPLPRRSAEARGANPAHTARMLKQVHLEQLCRDLGVPVGAFDMRVMTWLAAFAEPQVMQVLLGLVSRAHAAGRGELPTGPGGSTLCPTGDPWCRRGSRCPACESAQPSIGYGRPAPTVAPDDLAQHEAGA